MNLRRAVLVIVAVLAIPVVTQGQACLRKYKEITYYGYDHGSGPRCNAVVYPPGPVIEVGLRVIHCNGDVDTTGLTCFDIPPSTFQLDCQDCEYDPIDIAVKNNDLLPQPPTAQWQPDRPVAEGDVCPKLD